MPAILNFLASIVFLSFAINPLFAEGIQEQSTSEFPYQLIDTKKKQPDPTHVKVVADSIKTDSLHLTLELDSIPIDKTLTKQKKEIEPFYNFREGMKTSNINRIIGGITYAEISGKGYLGLIFSPEFTIGKVGIGINLPILSKPNDKYKPGISSIRTEILRDGVGPLRLIRYVRYGNQKTDPAYVRAGELSGTMIGFGGLVNNYTNTTSYEKRKVGLHFDFNFMQGRAGIEGLYSDFDPVSLNLLAIRPYYLPLIWSDIPIAKTLEIGTTFIKDKDQTIINKNIFGYRETYRLTEDGVGALGIDMGLVLFSNQLIQIDLFANYSKLNISSTVRYESPNIDGDAPFTLDANHKAGSGVSAGMNFRFNFIADVLSTGIKVERLYNGENYLPQFFDTAYELNKDAKITSLRDAMRSNGLYGSLTGRILGIVELGGSLLLPDQISLETPATVRLHADFEKLADKFSLHASYIKGGLDDLGAAFTFDERSLAKVSFIFHIDDFLVTGLDYYYYWEPNEYGWNKPVKYVMPYFGVNIPL